MEPNNDRPPLTSISTNGTYKLGIEFVECGDDWITARMPVEWTGMAGKVADGLNDAIIADRRRLEANPTFNRPGQPGLLEAVQALRKGKR